MFLNIDSIGFLVLALKVIIGGNYWPVVSHELVSDNSKNVEIQRPERWLWG